MSEREFPKVYCRFEGKELINGKRRQYWIQDATEDMFPEILDNLINGFLPEAPISKYLKCRQDPTSVKELKKMWIEMLHEKYSIVCLTQDAQENIELAGFNVLTESKADTKFVNYQVKGESLKKMLKIFDYAEKQRNFHKEFNLQSCMKSTGLYVLPNFRGEGFGEKLLEARELVCRNVGIRATISSFSSFISQKLASRAGYQIFYVAEFEDLGQIDPEMKISGIEEHTKNYKFMYKLYN